MAERDQIPIAVLGSYLRLPSAVLERTGEIQNVVGPSSSGMPLPVLKVQFVMLRLLTLHQHSL